MGDFGVVVFNSGGFGNTVPIPFSVAENKNLFLAHAVFPLRVLGHNEGQIFLAVFFAAFFWQGFG